MLRTTWLTILSSRGKQAASNINVSQLFCSKYGLQKGRSRSTLCNDVCYSKNKNKDVALCFWLTLDHNGRRGEWGRLRPEVQPVQPLNPFTYHFWQTRYPFLYFALTNSASLNIPRWELYILFFYCYKSTLLNMKQENHETTSVSPSTSECTLFYESSVLLAVVAKNLGTE